MAVIEGAITGNLAEVDSNKKLMVNLPTGQTLAGYVSNIFENDSGSLFGSKTMAVPLVSTPDRRLLVGLDTPQHEYTFNSTAQDTGLWKYVTATMTTTWGTTGMLLNANSDVTTVHGTAVSTWRSFPLTSDGVLEVSSSLNISAAPLANQVVEWGLFPFGAGTAAPTEGVYFRFSTAGLVGIINFNTTETSTAVMVAAGSIAINTTYLFTIKIHERSVSFWKDGILLAGGTLPTPAAQGQPFITTALPLTFQFRNAGTVAGSPVMQVKVLDTNIEQKAVNLGKPYPHIQVGKGLIASQATNGGTMGTTALYTNSLAAGAGAAMTNTTAALGTGLGGQFATQPTLGAGTDGIICSYQVPAGGINQTPRTLYITGIRIQGGVTTTLTGGPVLYAYSLAYGHSAASMATAEGVAAKAPRRIALGFETFVVTAAAGVIGAGVTVAFNSPVVVNPGEFVAVCAKNLGTVTSAGVINILIMIDGYWE